MSNEQQNEQTTNGERKETRENIDRAVSFLLAEVDL
jgi:hypothetical protein